MKTAEQILKALRKAQSEGGKKRWAQIPLKERSRIMSQVRQGKK